ncbi:MAG: DUF1289 domain-containing protein [Burkholderiaceae bacterium]
MNGGRHPGEVAPAPVPSPCIGVCRIEPDSGLCAGCRRTPGEIAVWPTATTESRLRILQQLACRRDA